MTPDEIKKMMIEEKERSHKIMVGHALAAGFTEAQAEFMLMMLDQAFAVAHEMALQHLLTQATAIKIPSSLVNSLADVVFGNGASDEDEEEDEDTPVPAHRHKN